MTLGGDPAAAAEVAAARGWRRWIASGLVRNAAALIGGTVFTQLIVFAVSPWLSRLYSAADFGNLANYNAWVAFLALVGCLRYEHAIIVAPDNRTAQRVLGLTIGLALVAFVLYAVGALALQSNPPAAGYIGHLREVALPMPAGVLAICVSSSLIQLAIKAGRFRRLAVVGVAQAALVVAVQVGLGIADAGGGLILGVIAGHVLSAVVLGILAIRDGTLDGFWNQVRPARLVATAREYVNFPRFTLAADGIAVVVQQFAPVFILALFDPVIAGLYAFAIRIVRVPLLVVSAAVSGALRKELSDRAATPGALHRLLRRTVAGLGVTSLVPFAVILLAGDDLFALVFGEQWRGAGRIVQILSPGVLLEFIAFPLAGFFLITGTQRYTLLLQSAGFALLVAALFVGRHLFATFVGTCYLLSAVMIVSNAWMIWLADRVAARHALDRAREPVLGAVPGEASGLA